MNKACFKNPTNLHCIDVFFINSIFCFQKTTTLTWGLSEMILMTVTFKKLILEKIFHRNYTKKLKKGYFKNNLRKTLHFIKGYELFKHIFFDVFNKDSILKETFMFEQFM